jgi:hypothetical protein
MPSATASAAPREALELHESVSLAEAAGSASLTRPDGTSVELGFDGFGNPVAGGVFDAQGRVPIHIIRPGIGKGRGKHLYESAMLEEAAPRFSGWKMYLNHLSPEAKRAAGGLPRDIRDSGGRVQESWWDPSVPEDTAAGHGQGAVVGMVRPVKLIRELIDDDPGLVEASISATATNVRPVTRDGQRVWLVEGINPRGSVDWVTEAGAGGRIVPLLQESYSDQEEMDVALLESMSDDELVAHLRRERPELLLAEAKKTEDDAEDESDGGDDELAEKTRELIKKGMPPAMAKKAAQKALSESTDDPRGGDVPDITPEAIKAALSASPDLLTEALAANGDVQVFITSLVEAKLEQERDSIRAEARSDVDRAFELARFERTAHGLIAESKLPESWQSDLKARFSLTENRPTDALDVEDETDEDGKVVKPAIDALRESVEAAIEHERSRLREASGTRVRSTAHKLAEAASSAPAEKQDGGDKPAGPTPYWATILSEAGVQDPTSAYALEG